MEIRELNDKEIKELDSFVFKVSMEGFNYALENYGPKEKIFDVFYKIPSLEAEELLNELMEKYNLEYS